MAKETTVNDNIYNKCEDAIDKGHDESSDKIHSEDEEQCKSECGESVGEHVVFGGVFAVFGSFVFWKRVFRSQCAVKSVGQLGDDEKKKGGAGIRIW